MHNIISCNLKIKNITTDINFINPGMIFVDLYHKTKDEFNAAFEKGASLIVTDSNISDNNLPIIKVKNIEIAYLKLLDLSNDNMLSKVNFAAIFGGNRGSIIASILESIFRMNRIREINYNDLCELPLFESQTINSAYVEVFYNYIINSIKQRYSIIPLSLDISNRLIWPIISQYTDCVIVEDYPNLDMVKPDKFKFDKPIIMNIDKPYALKMINEKTNNFIITYGLSKKATVTATSIDYGESTGFNYCLQRSFYSKKFNIIEPFETPLSLKGIGVNGIYAALASVSCALYYDIDINQIKKSLLEYRERGRNFLIKEYEDFILIDNYCTIYTDFKEIFEMVQIMNYQELYLLISGELVSKIQDDITIVKSLLESAINNSFKGIIICESNTNDVKVGYDDFILQAKKLNINIKAIKGLKDALIYTINKINKKDVLLVLGGKEFDTTKIIIELLLEMRLFYF